MNKLEIFILHFKNVKFNKGFKCIHLKILTVSTIFFNAIDKVREPSRVIKKNIRVRDLLLYFLWETGLYMNRQIGNLFGWTRVKLYSEGFV